MNRVLFLAAVFLVLVSGTLPADDFGILSSLPVVKSLKAWKAWSSRNYSEAETLYTEAADASRNPVKASEYYDHAADAALKQMENDPESAAAKRAEALYRRAMVLDPGNKSAAHDLELLRSMQKKQQEQQQQGKKDEKQEEQGPQQNSEDDETGQENANKQDGQQGQDQNPQDQQQSTDPDQTRQNQTGSQQNSQKPQQDPAVADILDQESLRREGRKMKGVMGGGGQVEKNW